MTSKSIILATPQALQSFNRYNIGDVISYENFDQGYQPQLD